MNEVCTPLSATPLEILSRTDFFAGLTPSHLAKVANAGRPVRYAKYGNIYEHGEQAKDFYVLVEGSVRFAVGFGDRNASTGDILRRGNVFGWAALTPRSNSRIATATCMTDCTVLAVDGAALVALMEQDHSLGYEIMKQLNLLITGTLAAFVAG